MKDSNGTELPEIQELKENTDSTELILVEARNSFIRACKIALLKGFVVVYNPKGKLATIAESAENTYTIYEP